MQAPPSGINTCKPVAPEVLRKAGSYQQSRQISELIARLISHQLRDISSIARTPRAREGKIYIDTIQNGYGKLLVSPFCVRPLPGAPVSMPLKWPELTTRNTNAKYTMRNAASRMRRLGRETA